MNTRLPRLAAGLLLLLPALAMAVPARRDVRTVTQPDGTTLHVRRVGDEHSHFLLTEDGLLLHFDEATGRYEYARPDAAGLLESTGVLAADAPARTSAAREVAVKLTPSIASRYSAAQRAASPRRALAQNGMGGFTNDFPRHGSPNVLVILVEYTDVKCSLSNPAEYFEAMLNEQGFSRYGGTGSCKDYFEQNTFGDFVPQFDFYGPVTLSHNRAYYGANDAYDEDVRAEEMVAEGCRLLDDQIDFSRYDNDGDGVVDNVYVFYAGEGEAGSGPASSIWPHAYNISYAGINLVLDGVQIDRYATSNEWESISPTGIGTFVHEFSHVVGLPDLYTTDYGEEAYNLTPGSWSVMDYGPYNNDGRTPPAYSVYERNAMGWCEPRLISEPCSISLQDIKSSNDACIILTEKENEFFLFENRQQTGWDAYIPGHGMLIWHIDFNQSVFNQNVVNNTASHQYVDIVEANGRANNDSDYIMSGYTWPGTSNMFSFGPKTTPAFLSWAGKDPGLPLTAIAEKNGVITFDVAGGTPLPPPIDTPSPTGASESGDDYFVAEWLPVEGAIDYEVKLYEQAAGAPQVVEASMGSGSKLSLPTGWTSSSTDVYSSKGNYGEASPSLKLSKDGAYLQTAEFDTDVQSISFWCRGQHAKSSTLEVLGLVGGSWVNITTISPDDTDVLTPKITDVPAGVRAVKFVWHKSAGNLSLDDIEIVSGQGDLLLSHITSTGGSTSTRFEGLHAGTFYYTVAATDGDYTTAHSAPSYVSIAANGILTTTVPAGEVEYYDMLGRRLLRPAPGTLCIERRPCFPARKVIIR